MIDYYRILEIPPGATDIQIRKAYLKLAKLYHPDINKDDVDAKVKFQMINMAYQFLINKENRTNYDKKRNEQDIDNEAYIRRKYGTSKGRYNATKRNNKTSKQSHKASTDYEFKEPFPNDFYFFIMLIIGIVAIILGILNLFFGEWDGINSFSGLTFGLTFTVLLIFGWLKLNNKI